MDKVFYKFVMFSFYPLELFNDSIGRLLCYQLICMFSGMLKRPQRRRKKGSNFTVLLIDILSAES